jgi:ABC-2 type transport system permease protein
MNSIRQQLFTIARKDIVDATRDKFFIVLIVFLSLAAFISLASGSVALATDINTYNAAKETLLALGKSLDAIAAPEFYPLKLLRGAVEQIEIVGAILGVLIGFRAAISERNHQTLSIVLVRPVSNATLMGGKVIAGITLIAASLLFVFTLLFITLAYFATTAIGMDDLFRIGIVWALSVAYMSTFFVVSMCFTFMFRSPSTALLTSFVLWLLLVLVAPQVGDTLDPDNQVAGGVFKQLHIPKAEQEQIKLGYATYETLRNGIETASVTKHFERASFAVLGIKDTYTGMALTPIIHEKSGDLWGVIISFFVTSLFAMSRKLTLKNQH